jgi:integrase
VKECAIVKKKPLSAYYVKMHHEDVRRHMASFQGFQGITLKKPKEKGILTPLEVSKLMARPITDARRILAVLFGLLCGLRRGECRGLMWGDISDYQVRP